MAFAALTVGMLETTLGRHDAASRSFSAVKELGGQFGNNWLQCGARTQLASIAVSAGHLEEARALLVEAMDTGESTELGTIPMTFSLVACARLALAEGDARRAAMALGAADGLRQRAGLRAWPGMRRAEAELVDRVVKVMEPETYRNAFASGTELTQREAVALVRGDR